MYKLKSSSVLFLSALAVLATPLTAQVNESETFASENAILDTAIPFAIGAREAQQSLRGSFGWPTYQEGLVQGVYFRFDPDGYARFSPTPRLDTDVFEVICRPRTYSCMGRKGSLSLILNSRGQLQIKLDDVVQGDTFYLSEGVSELQLPERILQPLDSQLESLLASGGDLIVKRGANEISNVSLVGFSAVSAYLRWIAARQDYTVLPRDWPVPNGALSQDSITQSLEWQSPMPQPQNFALPTQTATAPVNNEVSDMREELKIMRELLETRSATAAVPTLPTTLAATQVAPQNELLALQETIRGLEDELALMRQDQMMAPMQEPQMAPMPAYPTEEPAQTMTEAQRISDRLEYLMDEIGLDPKTALMLLEMGKAPMEEALPVTPAAVPLSPVDIYQERVVTNILDEIEEDLGATPSMVMPLDRVSDSEYQLLSQYFKSVALPERE